MTSALNLDGLSVTTTTGSTATVTSHYVEPEEGGAAGVREPRRPTPSPLAPMAMTVDDEAVTRA